MATKIDMNMPATAVVRGTVTQPSKLFSSLFRSLDMGRRLTILDVGAALPETVEFFSRFKCRIHFIDLFSEPVALRGLGFVGALVRRDLAGSVWLRTSLAVSFPKVL